MPPPFAVQGGSARNLLRVEGDHFCLQGGLQSPFFRGISLFAVSS
jgi:hypothetical protein